MKKVREAKDELTKKRIMLLFELGKEMGDNRTNKRNKYDKTLARRIYKSFEAMYSWML